METSKKIITVLGILMIILLIAGAASYKNFLNFVEVNRLETNNRIILKKLEIVLGEVTDAETGQRGYIITGNEDYLRPYHTAVATIDKDIKELRFMTKYNVGHQQMLDTLEPLIIEKLSGLAERINLRKNKGFDAAAREVLRGKGKDIMDKIRKTIYEMEGDVRNSLEQKKKEVESKTKRTVFFILFGSSLAFLIVGIASFITRKEFIVRKQWGEELKKHLAHLEELVAERSAELSKTNKQLEMEISEHKETEENLKERELRYRSLFKNSPISLWEEDFSDVKKYIDSLRSKGISDFRTYFQDHPGDVINCSTMVKVVDVNEVTLKMYQAGSVEDLRRGLDSVFTKKSYEVFKDALIALAEGKLTYASEAVNQTLGGRKIHIFIMWTVPPGYEATWSKGLVSIIDITERKQVEEQLKTALNEWRSTFDSAHDLIILLDSEMTIIKANIATAKFLNKSITEIIGEKYSQFFLARDRSLIACPFEKMKKTGKHEEEEFYLSERDAWLWISAYPVVDDHGNLTRGVLIIRDITENKQSRDQLKALSEQLRNLAAHLQSLREEERIIVSHEIHDELGHKLTGMKFDLMFLLKNMSGSEKEKRLVSEKIHSMCNLIDSVIKWARDLMTSLRPSILDDMGIEAALEWLVKESQRKLQIPCILNSSIKNFRPGDALAIAIFRICQECLTNISRYAHATSVTINLQEIDGNIMLEVIDNGTGIKEDQIKNPKAFGLVGMRERAVMLGGEFNITEEEGKGTRVTVLLPAGS